MLTRRKHFDITEAVHNKAAALTEIEERTSAQVYEFEKHTTSLYPKDYICDVAMFDRLGC